MQYSFGGEDAQVPNTLEHRTIAEYGSVTLIAQETTLSTWARSDDQLFAPPGQ